MIIESTIRNYLRSVIADIPVYLDIPPDPPDEYIALDRTGGSMTNYLNSVTIALQSYAKSRYRAAEINEEVKEAMLGIVALDDIAGCHLSSDYNFTNTATKWNRYQAIYEITHY